jgi:hypothetical protein
MNVIFFSILQKYPYKNKSENENNEKTKVVARPPLLAGLGVAEPPLGHLGLRPPEYF